MIDISSENQNLSREDEEAKRWMETLEADLMVIRENLRKNDILVDKMLEKIMHYRAFKRKKKIKRLQGRFKNYSLMNDRHDLLGNSTF